MADLNINNNTGFVNFSGGEQKTITKPFAAQLVNSNTIELNSNSTKINKFIINFSRYDNIYVDSILQTDIATLYTSLKAISVDFGASASIVDADTGTAVKVNDSGQMLVVLDGKVETNNTTRVLLSAGEAFTGEAVNTLDYAIINVAVFSDVESAEDGLCFQFSSDGLTDWRDSECYTILANKEKTFSTQAVRKFFRIKYTNGAIDQTAFDLQTIFKKTNSKDSSHRIIDNISGQDDSTLVKSVLTGLSPNGSFSNVELSGFNSLNVAIKEIVSDAFGRQKVSLAQSLMDSVIEHDVEGLYLNFLTLGGGTYNFDDVNHNYNLNVFNSGDAVICQTIQRGKYQPGKALEFVASTLMSAEENVLKRIGYCDVDNANHTPNVDIQNGASFEKLKTVHTVGIFIKMV